MSLALGADLRVMHVQADGREVHRYASIGKVNFELLQGWRFLP